MTHKTKLITAALVIFLTMLACGVNVNLPEDAIQTIPTVTEDILINIPDTSQTTNLKLRFGTGTMILHPGPSNMLVSGIATYNVEGLNPKITTSNIDVEINQDSFEYDLTGLPNFNDIENTWELNIGSHPIKLDIRAGAFKGEMDFGGLAIYELKLLGGASNITINFSSPNQVPMSVFTFTSGVSTVDLLNLANANFSLMNFDGGGGNYLLDFSGELRRDATIEIDAGLSNFVISVPEGIPARVNFTGSGSNVSISGAWVGEGNSLQQPGFTNGPTLTFNIKIGAGRVELTNAPQ